MSIVILGNGIAGVTAARHIRKRSQVPILLISDESDQFFSRTALMYVYMGHMRAKDIRPYEPWFWEKNRIELRRASITRIDFTEKKLYSTDGAAMEYTQLVLATGSVPNRFGWPGQDLKGVGGLYHWQDLERMEAYSEGLQRAVIVGGGLIGIEMAEMFHSRHIPVSFLVRENSFWNGVLPAEESAMINRHILEHGIDLQLSTQLDRIEGDDDGRCVAVVTDKGERIACGFTGLTAGVRPNVDFLKNTALEINRGILVDAYLRTNLPDVYAIGDCAELRSPETHRKAIEAVWYCGRMMGETVAHTLTGSPTIYQPGIWFNSAKFFDIEYQVYGQVPATPDPLVSSLYWEAPDGKKSIRINYTSETKAVTGFNLMGVRYRQEVCERWIQQGAHIEQVLQDLSMANFDPEFSTQHEENLVQVYNRQTGAGLTLRKNRGLNAVLRFLKT